MAGIGFELKKLFVKKGIFAKIKAYGYAGIVSTGPMILGIVFLLGIRFLASFGGASFHEQELLNSMITYTLLASLLISGIFAMVTTRFIADALYEEKSDWIIPSLHGSNAILLILGSVLYGVFLWNSGIPFLYQLLCLILFCELIVVWTEINYLTAIKDYKGILISFFLSLSVAIFTGYFLILLGFEPVPTLLFCITVGYGIMMVWYYFLLLNYFPKGRKSSFHFLKWVDHYPALVILSILMVIALFGHIVLMWNSSVGEKIQGLFYGAPAYDISALFAFLSILITTINFVVSVEVNFYPKYKTYFSLYNDGGSLSDIMMAEEEMKVILQKELEYTFTKQFFTTIIFIVGGTIILPKFPMNFTEDILGIYRVLCVGYAFYAIGNCLMLILLYFSDNSGAMWSSICFTIFSIIGTLVLRGGEVQYYGFGFLIGGFTFAVFALLRLWRYLKRLSYYILSTQPLVVEERKTILSGFVEELDERFEERNHTKENNKKGNDVHEKK